MGDYMLRTADRERIKVGTCGALYYLRFDQWRQVEPCGDIDLSRCIDRVQFRFMWPDEDNIPAGEFGDHDRDIEIPGYMPESEYPLERPAVGPIRLVRQKVVLGEDDDPGELQPIVRDSSGEHGFQCQMFRLNVFEAARASVCLVAAVARGTLPDFYGEVARRIMAGFALNPDWAETKVA